MESGQLWAKLTLKNLVTYEDEKNTALTAYSAKGLVALVKLWIENSKAAKLRYTIGIELDEGTWVKVPATGVEVAEPNTTTRRYYRSLMQIVVILYTNRHRWEEMVFDFPRFHGAYFFDDLRWVTLSLEGLKNLTSLTLGGIEAFKPSRWDKKSRKFSGRTLPSTVFPYLNIPKLVECHGRPQAPNLTKLVIFFRNNDKYAHRDFVALLEHCPSLTNLDIDIQGQPRGLLPKETASAVTLSKLQSLIIKCDAPGILACIRAPSLVELEIEARVLRDGNNWDLVEDTAYFLAVSRPPIIAFQFTNNNIDSSLQPILEFLPDVQKLVFPRIRQHRWLGELTVKEGEAKIFCPRLKSIYLDLSSVRDASEFVQMVYSRYSHGIKGVHLRLPNRLEKAIFRSRSDVRLCIKTCKTEGVELSILSVSP